MATNSRGIHRIARHLHELACHSAPAVMKKWRAVERKFDAKHGPHLWKAIQLGITRQIY